MGIDNSPQLNVTVDSGTRSCGIFTTTFGTVMMGWSGSIRMPGMATVAPTMRTPGGR